MRAFKTIMAIVFGGFAFFFFFMSFEEGVGQVPSIVLFVICALLTFAFGRKTAADEGRIAKQRQRAAVWEDALSDFVVDRQPKRGGDPLKRTLVVFTVLHVLALPFLVIRDLMKQQK